MNMIEILLAIILVGGSAGMLVQHAEVESEAETAREVVREIDEIASAAQRASPASPADSDKPTAVRTAAEAKRGQGGRMRRFRQRALASPTRT